MELLVCSGNTNVVVCRTSHKSSYGALHKSTEILICYNGYSIMSWNFYRSWN